MRIALFLRGWIATSIVLVVAAGTPAPASLSSVRLLVFPPPVAAAPQEVLAHDPVNGEPVQEDLAARRPLAVIIENFPAARPQWGLSLASRVYEALTEGGITRYLAIFGPNDADRVGPIRSARTQFLNYVLELDAALAHVGGNEDALDSIATFHVKDLDQFRHAGPYRRILRSHLALEHTMFASTRELRHLIDQAGWGRAGRVDHPAWKATTLPPARRLPQQVTIDFSFPDYRVAWRYRPGVNDYQRVLAGVPDIDAVTGKNVSAKAIMIAVVPRVHGRTQIREDTWTFSDIGVGRAWVVQDGTVTEGQWRKDSRIARLRFVNGAGREITLNRGRQWIEIIPPEVAPVFESPAPLQ